MASPNPSLRTLGGCRVPRLIKQGVLGGHGVPKSICQGVLGGHGVPKSISGGPEGLQGPQTHLAGGPWGLWDPQTLKPGGLGSSIPNFPRDSDGHGDPRPKLPGLLWGSWGGGEEEERGGHGLASPHTRIWGQSHPQNCPAHIDGAEGVLRGGGGEVMGAPHPTTPPHPHAGCSALLGTTR